MNWAAAMRLAEELFVLISNWAGIPNKVGYDGLKNNLCDICYRQELAAILPVNKKGVFIICFLWAAVQEYDVNLF